MDVVGRGLVGATRSSIVEGRLRPRDLTDAERDGKVRGQISQWLGRARHTATRRRRERQVKEELPRLQRKCRRGKDETGETKDVTWGFQTSPQVYYKYSPPEGKSGPSVRPLGGVK